MYKCPFCNSTDCAEVRKIPRSNRGFIEDDKEVQLMPNKFLYEMNCCSCDRIFTIDKDLYLLKKRERE